MLNTTEGFANCLVFKWKSSKLVAWQIIRALMNSPVIGFHRKRSNTTKWGDSSKLLMINSNVKLPRTQYNNDNNNNVISANGYFYLFRFPSKLTTKSFFILLFFLWDSDRALRIVEALIVKKHVDGISNINSGSFGLYKISKYGHRVTRG